MKRRDFIKKSSVDGVAESRFYAEANPFYAQKSGVDLYSFIVVWDFNGSG